MNAITCMENSISITKRPLTIRINSWPGARFSKVPKTLRARKEIRKSPTGLFCEPGLFISSKGNKNYYNCKVSCLQTPSFWRLKDNYVTRNAPEKFRDFWEAGPRNASHKGSSVSTWLFSSSGQTVSKILTCRWLILTQTLTPMCILRSNGTPRSIYQYWAPSSRHAGRLNHNLKNRNDTIELQRRLKEFKNFTGAIYPCAICIMPIYVFLVSFWFFSTMR